MGLTKFKLIITQYIKLAAMPLQTRKAIKSKGGEELSIPLSILVIKRKIIKKIVRSHALGRVLVASPQKS